MVHRYGSQLMRQQPERTTELLKAICARAIDELIAPPAAPTSSSGPTAAGVASVAVAAGAGRSLADRTRVRPVDFLHLFVASNNRFLQFAVEFLEHVIEHSLVHTRIPILNVVMENVRCTVQSTRTVFFLS